jgi:hypothetical protein
MYNKQKDDVLTTRINSIFGQIALLSGSSGKNKKGNPDADCLFGSRVASTGIEPVSGASETLILSIVLRGRLIGEVLQHYLQRSSRR